MLSKDTMKISAGSYDLNKFLFGGYEQGIITTIYGPPASGKTNLCMLAAVSQAKKGNKVLFIDTEGGFSIERFKQLAGKDSAEAIKNIILLQPTSFEEQKKAFSSLLKEIRGERLHEANNNEKERVGSRDRGKIGLILIDGMTMLYRLELAEARNNEDEKKIDEVNSELARQMRILSEIARKQSLSILVTNQGYSEFLSEEDLRKGKEKQFIMVGGSILQYWSKCIIELKNEKSRRKLILKKHRSLPEKEMEFEIVSSGIRKKGFFN